jgi:glycosyltransferase involved in cell wall biosynthesis
MNGVSSGNEAVPSGSFEQKIVSEPLVSVVTPFYNTREYLAECIESVLRQTYQNWEYVLVNNCSTDGSSDIAEQYALRFPHKIRVIHTPSFLSQVQNYNFALTCISPRSKYCKMVQADDWLFPDCVRAMVEVAEAHPSVGMVAAYEIAGDLVRLDGLPYPSPEVPGRDACRLYFLKGRYLFGSPTSSLLRSEAVRSRNPFYDEQYFPFEDGHVCFDLLKAWDFGFVHQVLTYTRWDNGGLMSRLRQFEIVPFLRLSMLVAHGKDYLSSGEYDRCLKRAERQYCRYLAKHACALRRESREFWEFQRSGLASIKYSLGWRLLAKWIPRALLEKAWGAFWRVWDRDSRADFDNGSGIQQPRTAEITRADRGTARTELP